ncbi:hypothetical protein CANINC_004481 [Pichia inconspicua]|uniref:Uncharacterized protein n=1 Tax=Pichia inconspicua TaxID=52247 RepID=A0A4T0WWY2_9ASCO|nr:hypothetical protein CANINC_004481 [[Candida] inconspicua]
MTDHANQYRSALNDSLSTTIAAVDALRNGETDLLSKIQHDLIFDTLQLTRAKNNFKRAYSTASAQLESTVINSQNPKKNPFALKCEQQRYLNVLEWDSLRRTLDQIPELKLNAISHILDIPKNITTDEIHNRLWLLDDQTNIDDVLITPENATQITEALDESDKQKFKLVQLHDKYYQWKISSLKETERKWRNELTKLTQFINNDITKFRIELEGKLLNDEINENNVATGLESDGSIEGDDNYDNDDIEMLDENDHEIENDHENDDNLSEPSAYIEDTDIVDDNYDTNHIENITDSTTHPADTDMIEE